jgi:hypothetical protein
MLASYCVSEMSSFYSVSTAGSTDASHVFLSYNMFRLIKPSSGILPSYIHLYSDIRKETQLLRPDKMQGNILYTLNLIEII